MTAKKKAVDESKELHTLYQQVLKSEELAKKAREEYESRKKSFDKNKILDVTKEVVDDLKGKLSIIDPKKEKISVRAGLISITIPFGDSKRSKKRALTITDSAFTSKVKDGSIPKGKPFPASLIKSVFKGYAVQSWLNKSGNTFKYKNVMKRSKKTGANKKEAYYEVI